MSSPNSGLNLHFMLGVDGSEHALAAVNLLRDLPLTTRSTISAIAVILPRNASDHAALEAMLGQTQRLLQEKGVAVTTELRAGSPAGALVEYAEAHKPDVIVLGAKGLRATLAILLGGVAQQVMEYASCPVLIVRAPYTGLRRVLLVTDGSEYSRKAEEFLVKFPLPADMEFRLMHVMPPLPAPSLIARTWPLDADLFAPIPTQEFEEASTRQAEEEERVGQELLARRMNALKMAGFDTTSVLRRGDAATEILHYAKEQNIDLIVAGARGVSGLKGWLLGSVSRKLVHYANCSVMIVKGPRLE